MGKIKKFMKDKQYGFYVSVGIIVLSLVTAAVYTVCYSNTRFMSWAAFVSALVGTGSAVALCCFKQIKWVPAVLALCNFLALLLFIYGIYFYVSVVLVGIQIKTFSSEFIACTVLFMLTFAFSVANIFFKQVKTAGSGIEIVKKDCEAEGKNMEVNK